MGGVGGAGGDCDEVVSDGLGGRAGVVAAGERAGGAGEVEREAGQHQPGGVRGEPARRKVGQGAGFQVGDDLFDDRVAAVGRLGRHEFKGLSVNAA